MPPGMNSKRHIDIMGIVNLTDDSYFAQSRCLPSASDCDQAARNALERARTLVSEGADIIDIGACSTRPGSEPVGEAEEWKRLQPALSLIRRELPQTRISIDTYWASVVRQAFDLIGSFIVNDISAGAADTQMLPTVGRLGLPYVAMHMRGTPKNMQSLTDYNQVTAEVYEFFTEFAQKASFYGISDWILDPGFGFAKTIGQNYQLLRGLSEFRKLRDASGNPRKILIGVSRKSMIYKLFDITPEESLPATQVLHLAALQNGADILRVHDISEAARTVELYRRLF